jgi:hypothetical protein
MLPLQSKEREKGATSTRENSDSLTGHIFPPAAVKKIGAAKAILAETLNSMPSGTDATAAGVK